MNRDTAHYVMGCGIGILSWPLMQWLMDSDFSFALHVAIGVAVTGYGFTAIVVSRP